MPNRTYIVKDRFGKDRRFLDVIRKMNEIYGETGEKTVGIPEYNLKDAKIEVYKKFPVKKDSPTIIRISNCIDIERVHERLEKKIRIKLNEDNKNGNKK